MACFSRDVNIYVTGYDTESSIVVSQSNREARANSQSSNEILENMQPIF